MRSRWGNAHFIGYLVLAALLYGLAGCLGAGDAFVISPPLHIEGKVVDEDGSGLDGEAVRITLRRRTSLHDTGESVSAVRTASDGSFTIRYPSHSYLHPVGVIGPFTIGEGRTDDIALRVTVGEEELAEYFLDGHHEKVEVRQVVRQGDGRIDEEKLDNPDAVVAELERSEELNKMTLVIMKE